MNSSDFPTEEIVPGGPRALQGPAADMGAIGAPRAELDQVLAPRQRGRAFRRFIRHRLAVISVFLLLVVVAVSILAPLIAPYSPSATDLNALTATGPSPAHWLGTDDIGEDVLSRLLYGGRISLGIGVAAAMMSLVIGLIVGAIAGWFGGLVDTVLMRFVDLVLCFPALFILLIVFALVPASPTIIIVFLGAFGWLYLARIVRGEFLSLKEREFVQGAQALGVGSARIIWRHLLPNVVAAVIVSSTLNIAYNMLGEATLDFLGFGVSPDTPTWGNMLTKASDHYTDQPLLAIAPGLTITLVILAINFVGDGLRDALDPRLQ
jgi:peptide/nickel transport system permease protein